MNVKKFHCYSDYLLFDKSKFTGTCLVYEGKKQVQEIPYENANITGTVKSWYYPSDRYKGLSYVSQWSHGLPNGFQAHFENGILTRIAKYIPNKLLFEAKNHSKMKLSFWDNSMVFPQKILKSKVENHVHSLLGEHISESVCDLIITKGWLLYVNHL